MLVFGPLNTRGTIFVYLYVLSTLLMIGVVAFGIAPALAAKVTLVDEPGEYH
jgi:uncharacterized membrane protein YesL